VKSSSNWAEWENRKEYERERENVAQEKKMK